MENKTVLLDTLKKEDLVMDSILLCQMKIHEAVKDRDWLNLETNITKMQGLTVDFISLEDSRNSIKQEKISEKEHELMKQIQSKLLKSKIANSALNDYIKISRGFVQNVLENVVPQRRNVLYSKNGSIVKTQPQSVVLNKVF
ncbi:hypothetical protein [Treponema sp.]|uniref:hypothetical protein n=1 Tax=Treponema sp. TaxID=166 RepID=UPI00298E2D4C|nr:hypothetical protein [Treponema sp.]MCR5613142.1 hypothetical protein [Treponema sp.]